MSEKHTAGPWFVMEGGFARQGLWSAPTVYAADDELRYVAVCACADQMNIHSATDNLANAYLISATPQLLEALKDMLAGWRYIRQTHGDLYGVGWDRCEQLANDAIAKTTGEQP